jgi:DNA ligase (NAD+)
VEYKSDSITQLANQLMHHKRLYYAGAPAISDTAYDALEAKLQQLAPNHPALSYVGSDSTSLGAKVAHAAPMLSLAKTYDLADLQSWQDGQAVVGMYKVDGNSLSVLYEDGKLQLAKTRGNGRLGEDVTEKAAWVADILPSIDAKQRIEIRGELYCTETGFVTIAEEFAALGIERPTSPRNIVAGLLGRKNHFHLARYFNFFGFDVLFPDGEKAFKTEMEKFDWLTSAGFATPEQELLENFAAVELYLAKVKLAMAEGEIGLDGAVFSYNDLRLHDELGNTSHHPRYKMSYKWQGETAVVTIKNFLWATSRLGYVTPVAVVEPVFLSGAEITNITLHNAAHVRTFNLKAGDRIEIIRSGEVIPKFLSVVEEVKGTFSWPDRCDSCGTKLEFDDVRLKCVNVSGCPAQQMGTILNWIRNADIDDLSEKRLEMLVDAKLVRTVGDLYRLSVDDFLKLPMTKAKMATKLFQNIQNSKSLDLARFLNGLGIEGTGLTSWEKILEEYSSLKDVRAASVEGVLKIHGFAEKSAKQIVEGLAQRAALIDDLLSVGVSPKPPASNLFDKNGVLAGKQLAITGSLSLPRAKIEELIKQAGGRPASSVSKNTFAVVTNDTDSTSSKMKKAIELGVPIWSEERLLKELKK